MDAEDLAVFRKTRRSRRSAWGPRHSVYPAYERRSDVYKKGTGR